MGLLWRSWTEKRGFVLYKAWVDCQQHGQRLWDLATPLNPWHNRALKKGSTMNNRRYTDLKPTIRQLDKTSPKGRQLSFSVTNAPCHLKITLTRPCPRNHCNLPFSKWGRPRTSSDHCGVEETAQTVGHRPQPRSHLPPTQAIIVQGKQSWTAHLTELIVSLQIFTNFIYMSVIITRNVVVWFCLHRAQAFWSTYKSGRLALFGCYVRSFSWMKVQLNAKQAKLIGNDP